MTASSKRLSRGQKTFLLQYSGTRKKHPMTDTQRNSSRRSSAHQRNSPLTAARAYASLLGIVLIALIIIPVCGCRRTDDGRLPGYLSLRLNNNPTTLDPALITDVQGGGIAAKLFNGLVRFSENLDIVPDLARSWQLSADQM